MKLHDLCKELEKEIQNSYESGVTIDEAEKLAAKFLNAQIQVSRELSKTDLDSRMKRSGVKAVRAAVYLDEIKRNDKKPTEAMLTALLDSNDICSGEQMRFDEADSYKCELERYYDIFLNAHIYYRGIAKGKFE